MLLAEAREHNEQVWPRVLVARMAEEELGRVMVGGVGAAARVQQVGCSIWVAAAKVQQLGCTSWAAQPRA